MELYETTTNGTKPSTVSLNHMGLTHKGIHETSISGGEDELISNKSDDRFSGQTDFEMVSGEWGQRVSCELTSVVLLAGDSSSLDDGTGQSPPRHVAQRAARPDLDGCTGHDGRYEYILNRRVRCQPATTSDAVPQLDPSLFLTRYACFVCFAVSLCLLLQAKLFPFCRP